MHSMPQVDLETETETTLAGDDITTATTTVQGGDEELPPESFRLSRDAEHDWFERCSYCCYEREDSNKGNLLSSLPSSNSSSQRFSVNLKTKANKPIIGLSKNIQRATYVDPKWRATCNKPASGRVMFPRRFGPTAQVAEPGSPLVSCMGRVRSKRCRRRSNSVRRSGEKQLVKKDKKKTGFCSRVLDLFRSKKTRCKKTSRSGSSRKPVGALTEENAEPVIWRSVSVRRRGGEPAVAESEPPALGGMKRFSSGRRSCSSFN